MGGLMMVLAAAILYQLADRDGRRGWLWAGITLVLIMVLTNVIQLGSLGLYLGFLIALGALIYTRPVAPRR